MPEAQLYPGARWHPLGAQTESRMTAHDIVCLHTMVGYLTSTDPYFRVTNGIGFAGTESHYGVGGKWGPDLGGALDGASWQWQDRAFSADANLDGWDRVISIETADNAPRYPSDIEAWTPAQIEELAQILAWESTAAAHAACPPSWRCHQVGIPLELIPDTKPGRRGVGYHRQGVDPYRVDGGERWSTSYGKACPGDRRIAQIPAVLARARQIIAGDPPASPPPLPEETDMPTAQIVTIPPAEYETVTDDAGATVERLVVDDKGWPTNAVAVALPPAAGSGGVKFGRVFVSLAVDARTDDPVSVWAQQWTGDGVPRPLYGDDRGWRIDTDQRTRNDTSAEIGGGIQGVTFAHDAKVPATVLVEIDKP